LATVCVTDEGTEFVVDADGGGGVPEGTAIGVAGLIGVAGAEPVEVGAPVDAGVAGATGCTTGAVAAG